MGYTTDFIGHVDIEPHLNAGEIAYLEAFRHARHFDRGGSAYDVPGNPLAPDHEGVPNERYNALAPGKPQLYCQWAICGSGCCLAYDGNEKFYQPVAWLRYLIDHLLAPGALAEKERHHQLAEFTFDHRLNGMIVGCRRDTRELFAITVTDNVVATEVLRAGDAWDEPPLAYQEAIDRDRDALVRRRRDSPAARARARGAGTVVDLGRRRS
ncbi:hypothetical protein [Nocardioides sp.]|uniref:hypothetical protein n=1 Tax=Nocardioides sp. TaxID=35761 RepID=UPI00378401DE